MKNIILKKYHWFILLILGTYSHNSINSQTCTGNKVWACRTCTGWYGTTYQECDCIPPNKVAGWQATPCSVFPTNNGNHGNGNNGNDGGCCVSIMVSHKHVTGELPSNRNLSHDVYPNPISNSTTIYVTLLKKEKISLRIFDLNGRPVSILANDFFEAGEHRIEWSATDVKAGIYLLRLQTSSSIQTRKLIVLK